MAIFMLIGQPIAWFVLAPLYILVREGVLFFYIDLDLIIKFLKTTLYVSTAFGLIAWIFLGLLGWDSEE